MDWIHMFLVVSIIGVNIFTVVAMYVHTDMKLTAMQQELKTFYDRLCAIAERTTNKTQE